MVRSDSPAVDQLANDRDLLLTLGISAYSKSGIIGRPSLAEEGKGYRLLAELVTLAREFIEALH